MTAKDAARTEAIFALMENHIGDELMAILSTYMDGDALGPWARGIVEEYRALVTFFEESPVGYC